MKFQVTKCLQDTKEWKYALWKEYRLKQEFLKMNFNFYMNLHT